MREARRSPGALWSLLLIYWTNEKALLGSVSGEIPKEQRVFLYFPLLFFLVLKRQKTHSEADRQPGRRQTYDCESLMAAARSDTTGT